MTLQRMALLGAGSIFDPDAAVYIAAVEAADGQALETGVRNAYNNFFIACKTDGNLNLIKAACILAGARTLAGALVPLVGTAPTNINFVTADYNRKTGLAGNGTNKYLNSNRLDSADPQNSFHQSIYLSQAGNNSAVMIGCGGPSYSEIATTSLGGLGFYNRSSTNSIVGTNAGSQFLASARSVSTAFSRRYGGGGIPLTATSIAPNGRNYFIFAENASGTPNFFSSARLAFYSIGETLDLVLLDSRVTTLINALAAAIP